MCQGCVLSLKTHVVGMFSPKWWAASQLLLYFFVTLYLESVPRKLQVKTKKIWFACWIQCAREESYRIQKMKTSFIFSARPFHSLALLLSNPDRSHPQTIFLFLFSLCFCSLRMQNKILTWELMCSKWEKHLHCIISCFLHCFIAGTIIHHNIWPSQIDRQIAMEGMWLC